MEEKTFHISIAFYNFLLKKKQGNDKALEDTMRRLVG